MICSTDELEVNDRTGFVPTLAALNMEERAILAQAVERAIGPAFRNYVEGDEGLYPMSAHIALARKL